jgi:hypothetical protein
MCNFSEWVVECVNGIVSVCGPNYAKSIDCRDPLTDAPLIEFNRSFPGPASVAMRVEEAASQYRRILVSSPEWSAVRDRHRGTPS